MKIDTKLFTNLVNKSYKGSSNNKLIPLTTLMCISVEDNKLKLITSNDEGSYLYVLSDEISDLQEDFYVTTYSEQLFKLVNKLTSETIELLVDNEVLNINTSNGKYKIELPLDENGENAKYPDPISERDIDYDKTISLSDVEDIISINKSSLLNDEQYSVYKNYYIGDKVVSTDSLKVCSNDLKLFDDCEPMLLSKELLDILKVMEDDEINVSINNNEIIFMQDNYIVFGYLGDYIEEYEIDMISSLCEIDTDSSCKVYKSLLLETLDRLNIFVGPYDNNAIVLSFSNNAINVSSVQTSAIETITYEDVKNHSDFECKVPIDLVIEQIKVIPSEIITIEYGNDKVIKFVNDDVVQVIALLD